MTSCWTACRFRSPIRRRAASHFLCFSIGTLSSWVRLVLGCTLRAAAGGDFEQLRNGGVPTRNSRTTHDVNMTSPC